MQPGQALWLSMMHLMCATVYKWLAANVMGCLALMISAVVP
jgi:hypothetical protein